MAVTAMLAGNQANAGESPWRVAERVDVEKVPSWFPVGFSLLTHGQRQYVAYYDAKHHMTVGARTLGERLWQLVKLDSKVGWDSHNGITMTADANGDLHLSGNMHCVPLIYFRTEKPGDITTFRRLPMTGEDERRCTYPHFLNDAAGRLVFHYRDGGSGNGRRLYNVYDAKSRTWSRLLKTPLFDGQGKRNAYPGGPLVGPDKRFHAYWVWRDNPDCATNNNLSYARSSDLIHWETAAGDAVELPMTLETEGLIVDPIPSHGGIINGGARLVFDSQRRPMLAYHKSDAKGNMQFYVARFDQGKWTRRVITAWEKPVKFSGRGAMPFIGIRISTPRRIADGVWAVGYRHRDYGRGEVAFSEATLEPVAVKIPPRPPGLPAELSRPEIKFKGIRVRTTGDLGDSGDPNVRYVLKWDVLPPNYDRKRKGPLPPASMLRLYKLIRGPAQSKRQPRGYTIPAVDLADQKHRQVLVDREEGQYLGHVSTVMLEDNKTIIAVYPKGHGRGAIVMKRSTDGGKTWSGRLPTPKSWATSLEVPTCHRVVDAGGVKRLILFSGLYPIRMAVSEDDGATWSELKPIGDFGGIVAMGDVMPLRTPGHYLAMFHDDGRFFTKGGKRSSPTMFALYQTISTDGGLTWGEPTRIHRDHRVHLCEPGMVRSPNGGQIAALLRENSRTRNSHVIFSDDEGKTWSTPAELPGALTGDRHTIRYAPDGRLVATFRDMCLDSPTRGDWVAWVGTYRDIVEGREGQFRVRLMDNRRGADCAYPGLEALPDGTFVATTYGHWTAGKKPYIVSVRFTLAEIEALARPAAE